MVTPANVTRKIQGITYKRINGVWKEVQSNGTLINVTDSALLYDLKNNISKDESTYKTTTTQTPAKNPTTSTYVVPPNAKYFDPISNTKFSVDGNGLDVTITYSDGTQAASKTSNPDTKAALSEQAAKGNGPELQKVVVPTTEVQSLPVIPFTEPLAIDADINLFKDRSTTELLQDKTLVDGFLQDSVVTLQNTLIDPTLPGDAGKETLYDRLTDNGGTGVTQELRNKFGPQIDNYLSLRQRKQAILDEIKKRVAECRPVNDANNGWSAPDKKCKDGFNYSQLRAMEEEIEEEINTMADPCGKSTLAGINNALLKFFNFLKESKKFYNVYVKGTINKIRNITAIIGNTAVIISAVLKLLIQRMRNFILNLIRKLIEKIINKIMTSLTKALKNTVIKVIIDSILCAFDKIIDGLTKLVTDFLFSLIGNVINAAFCAVEQFTNALLNNLSASIDKQLKPILNKINDVLGGVAKIAGSVFQAVDYILGFEAFLCAKPDCPEIKSFKIGSGSTNSMKEAFDKMIPIPDAAEAEKWVLDKVGGFLDKNNILTGATVFGKDFTNLNQSIPGRYESQLRCNTGAWRCGPPQVEFFGGGGSGAVGDAIVNNIGEVLGVNLRYGGQGYTSPPFVTFNDNCGQGNFASAYTITNNVGEVIKVIMVNTGRGYVNSPTGLDEFQERVEEEVVENDVREYVGCLEEIEILSTGIGYTVNDSISITPDIPGLQVKVQMTDVGQIVAMVVETAGCGITETPTITINSKTGAGLEVRPIIAFTEKNDYLAANNNRPDFNAAQLIKVTQCVLK
jgi:hypothetical protein